MGNTLGFLTLQVMPVFEFFLEGGVNKYYEGEVIRKTDVSKGSAGKILKTANQPRIFDKRRKGADWQFTA
jgi:hypothetical protein